MLPSATDLIYFQEIIKTKNLTNAAIKLGVTQPSLTLALQRLEKMIGETLFVRHKQGVTLTKAGNQLSVHTKRLLDNWEEVKHATIASHKEIQGIVNLGCHSATAIYFKYFFPTMLEDYPKLTFNLIHDVGFKLLEKVINSTLDIAIVVNPMMHPDLIIQKLSESETSFWKGKGLRPQQNIHSDKLVIICDPNILRTAYLLKKMPKQKVPSLRLLTTSSLEIVADLTAGGCGIGILPSAFATYVSQPLERIQSLPTCRDELYIVYRKESRDVKTLQMVINTIKQYAKR